MTRTRLILVLTLMLALAGGAVAQETTTAAETAGTKTAARAAEPATPAEDSAQPVEAVAAKETEPSAENSTTSYQLRNQFSQLLRQHPPELSTILALDPTLLSNQAYLSAYPELASFVAAHPEVQRNPRFYLGEFQERPRERQNALSQLMEGIAIFATIGLITFALGWLVRTIIEQKRWNRLSKTQTEVHNKILDRFSTSEEVLNYVKSPAGSKFLESAPIPLRAEEPTRLSMSPLSRVMLSIQLGAGLAVGAAGLLLLSLRFDAETAEGVFAMGAVAFCVGAGFIASAVVSILVSKRLGFLGNDGVLPRPDDSSAMR